jgi:hypothetical protein
MPAYQAHYETITYDKIEEFSLHGIIGVGGFGQRSHHD